MRVAVEASAGPMPDVAERLLDPRSAPTWLVRPAGVERLQQCADREELVERGERVLEDGLDVAPVRGPFPSLECR